MAAVCGVKIVSGICEVGAVGRCTDCGSAFCLTHSARQGQTRLVDLCTECLVRRDAVRAAIWSQSAEARLRELPGIRSELIASEVPTVEVHSVQYMELPTRWPRRRRFGDVSRWADVGWLLGDLTWSVTRGDSSVVETEVAPTVLLRDPEAVRRSRNHGLVRARIHEEFGLAEPIGGYDTVPPGGWEAALAAVEALIAGHRR